MLGKHCRINFAVCRLSLPVVTQQILLVWGQEFTGVDSTTVASGQFIKFSNANSDPVSFVDEKKTEMEETTGRMPNRLALGVNVFNALKRHPAILERVKYGGSTANPASVTLNVLAQLFEIDRITVQRT